MKRSVVLLVTCFVFLASAAHAQENDQSPQKGANEGGEEADKNALQTVYVTATKRTESVRDVPASIDAFTGADLEKQGLTTLEDILRFSPGVTVLQGNTPDSMQINFRGAGSDRGAFNRPFGTFYEDVPLVNPTFTGPQPDIDPYDMQAVEVVKGPQGTLFGGSALIGAVRYVPNRPSYDKFDANVGYGFGKTAESDDLSQSYTAMFNVPFNDRIAMRVAGSIRDNAGIIDDTFHGIEDVNSSKATNWRALLGFQATDRVDIQLLYQDRHVDSDANVGTEIDNADGRQVNAFLRDGKDGYVSDLDLTTLKVNWSLQDDLTLSLVSGLLNKKATIFINELFSITNGFEDQDFYFQDQKSAQYTHELRLVQDRPTEGPWLLRDWTYVTGLFYMDAEQDFDLQTVKVSGDPAAPLPLLLSIDAEATTKEKAFYFDSKRKLNSKFDLNLGVRVFEQETPLFLGLLIYPGTRTFVPDDALLPFVNTTQLLKESGVNPKGALTYHLTDNISTFLGASRGFRFGGVNLDVFGTGEPPDTFKSDYLWNYELGWRSTWLNNRLQVDSTIFWVNWADKQTSQVTSAASEYIANTGGRRMRGIEFSVRRSFEPGLMWTVNGGYVQSKTTEDYTSPVGDYTPAGIYETETPRWTGSTSLDYGAQVGAWNVDSWLAYSYRTHTTQTGGFIPVPIKSYGLADFYVALQNANWKFSPTFSLNVSNLTNEETIQWGGSNPPAPGLTDPRVRARTVQPRTAMLTVRFDF